MADSKELGSSNSDEGPMLTLTAEDAEEMANKKWKMENGKSGICHFSFAIFHLLFSSAVSFPESPGSGEEQE
ncbi:MAG: hypothetical protein AABN33_10645 [Acidobacteriota bacterium]